MAALPTAEPAIGAPASASPCPDPLDSFHPAVATWFREKFPGGASEPQRAGWPAVRRGRDVVIAAPTGSGKTLSGFLVAIDSLFREPEPPLTTRVVYISPLKALAVDVHENLDRPLAGIADAARRLGLEPPALRTGVRTGDTSASERTALVKVPPHILVTTPESLFLLLTAARGRETLRDVHTVIVDEIHALARDKRGSHLALSLERLDALQHGRRPQRIGLSATQKPIDSIARLLAGTPPGADASPSAGGGDEPDGGRVEIVEGARRTDDRVEIVDCGHRRDADIELVLPRTELAAVASDGQFTEILDSIAGHVGAHRTTLVFVNTRRMAERVAHQLSERLGDEAPVCAHHGSLSKDRRQSVEARLRAGELRALVATASLELGIDVGPVELVCQIGSPRSIATFLQRVGRSNHTLTGTPRGLVYPMTRDELVECAALVSAARAGRLDAVVVPETPLDVLAQQIVAEVACVEEPDGWDEDALFDLVRRAAPFAALTRDDFDLVVTMLAEGIETGRGRRGAYLHRDGVNGVLRPRRGARLAALTNAGAIPEVGDYRVVLEPSDTFLGTVNEDFAIESMVGDVFLLGSHSWQVRQVTQGTVRVVDAGGAHPTIPFWVGEAPARTAELSEEVSRLRRLVDERLGSAAGSAAGSAGGISAGSAAGSAGGATVPGAGADLVDELAGPHGIGDTAARQIVDYLGAARVSLGAMPTASTIVFERFFDEAGGMQLVVHCPLGARVNRALGLALRKRFCTSFDFELQAAASDDAVVLSLGPQHSFPLPSVASYLRSHSAAEVLSQAVLTSPMFAARWRWNLNRALVVLRQRGSNRTPLAIQRMESDDLMAAVFPALAACQENAPAGPIAIPDHVLVRQTLHDCLHEAMDVDGLVDLLAAVEAGSVETVFVDSTEPSPLSHEIVNGRPYTFLDDAPLEERRTRAVPVARGLPVDARELGALEPEVIERVSREVAPDPRSAEELHDLLLDVIVLPPVPDWVPWFDHLAAAGRALTVGAARLWCSTERRDVADSALSGDDEAAARVVRGHLDVSGPRTVEDLSSATALAPPRVAVALGILESEGFALRVPAAGLVLPPAATGGDRPPNGAGVGVAPQHGTGSVVHHPNGAGDERWCARRVLQRIHASSRTRRRGEIRPVSRDAYLAFLARWQHSEPGLRLSGRAGVASVIDQLQGFEIPAGLWESDILARRVEGYDPRWLDDLCLSGEVVWGRFAGQPARDESAPRRGSATPSRATPITFARRDDAPWLLQAARWPGTPPAEPDRGPSKEILEALRSRGALFHAEIRAETGRLPVEVEEGLWDLVARGLATADGFQAVRSLLSSRDVWQRRQRVLRRGGPSARAAVRLHQARSGGEGRWVLLPAAHRVDPADGDPVAEAVAEQLLVRWGVVFFDIARRERFAIPWREVLWALRRMEARGQVRGGYFVTGITGEQFALPEAAADLGPGPRHVRTPQSPPARGHLGPGPRHVRTPQSPSARGHLGPPLEGSGARARAAEGPVHPRDPLAAAAAAVAVAVAVAGPPGAASVRE